MIYAKWQSVARALLIACVAAAAYYFIDFEELVRTLSATHWPWLLLLMVLSTVDRFLMAGKWWQLLQHLQHQATFGSTLSAYYQVAFMQRIIPSSLSGDALRALLLSKRFQQTNAVLASMIVEKLVAIFAALLLAILGLQFLLLETWNHWDWGISITLTGLGVALAAITLLSLHRPFLRLATNWAPERIKKQLEQTYSYYLAFSHAPTVLWMNFFYCLLEQVVQSGMWLLAAISVGVEVNTTTIFAALLLAQCIRKFAIVIDGWLFGEFTMVVILSLAGIPESQALAFSLLTHACAVIASIPGAFLFARSTVSLTETRRTT